jgi:hypothetical protein
VTAQQDREWQVLEYIYDNDQGNKGGASIGGLRDLVGEEDAAAIAFALRSRGLIRNEQRLSGGYHITADGQNTVEQLRGRRADRSYRRVACREAFLRWVDSKTTTNAGSRISRDKFDLTLDGLPFADAETEAAASYLKERGLISSISSGGTSGPHILVWITELGSKCVDSGVSLAEFLTPPPARAVSNVFNMGGTGNSFATATAAGATANATVTNFNLDQARSFAAAVRAAASELDLTEEAEAALAEIEQCGDDVPRAHRATQILHSFLVGTTTGTLGQVLGTLGASALGIM